MSENTTLSAFDFDPSCPYGTARPSWPVSISQTGSARAAPSQTPTANIQRSATPRQNHNGPVFEHSVGTSIGSSLGPFGDSHDIPPHLSSQQLPPNPQSIHQHRWFPPQPTTQHTSYHPQQIPLHHGLRPPMQSITQAMGPPMAPQQQQSFSPAGAMPASSHWSRSRQDEGSPAHAAFAIETQYSSQSSDPYHPIAYQPSPADYGQGTQAAYDDSLAASYLPLGQLEAGMPFAWQDISNGLLNYTSAGTGHPDLAMPPNLPNSPSTSLEVRSLSSSDNGWGSVDYTQHSFDGSPYEPQLGAIFNPEQTLHGRTFSDSSFSDVDQTRLSWGSFVDIPQHAIGSPSSDSAGDVEFANDGSDRDVQIKDEKLSSPILALSKSAISQPIKIKTSKSPPRNTASSGRTLSPARRPGKRSPNVKAAKATIRRQSQVKPETEKRVGRRKGPLRPEQRKQASEIRKLGACLRCRFLKKTCDKGEPCGGCQPSHARLWQVPCTRIDIKEIAYFMRDWNADYERHAGLGFSVDNIKGFAHKEHNLWITHGYGHVLPVRAREVFVRDEGCFDLEWVESVSDTPTGYSVNTAKLSAGVEGIPTALLGDYLDRHIDMGFEEFVDDFFQGTFFITEMLKTAYRFWVRERTPVIRKALKFLLAYNLTQHVTMVEAIGEEEEFQGKIDDETSKFYGKTVAPVMINFQVKVAMAAKWREYQKDVLEELSQLYSSVYTKDKLRHWPTIFMVVSILLVVWEEMQFDCHYRIQDKEVVNKFCADMESTPVGVIVGLFAAISQKLPALHEWETQRHGALLGSNESVCQALTEVREHVTTHDQYLRTRCDTAFDRDDFDSLSCKFTSKLVIRASAS